MNDENVIKSERIALRVTPTTRRLLELAAATTDRDLSGFVVSAARERAERIVAERDVYRIDAENRERFFDLVATPPGPSDALKALFGSTRFRTDDGRE